jgi:two-component system, chemotaxis family, chemotaxis protein CheY
MQKSILIVDDSPVIRKSLRKMLQEYSEWQVSGEAVNGREALIKAQELKPDLIVLDLSMPVMNGLEAARELKRLDPTTPLLMFTTFKTDHLEREAKASGCSAVVSKSETAQLLAGIRNLLGVRAQAS